MASEASYRADFVADAGGRRGAPRPHHKTGASTLAVYGYWRGAKLPTMPRIEAGEDGWYWGVPLPDGTYNTLAFVDPGWFRSAPGDTMSERFLRLLDRSRLMQDCRDAELIAPVRAIDATPYLSGDCVAPQEFGSATRRSQSTRFPRAACKRRSRPRCPAPSSPTRCCAGPARRRPRSAFIARSLTTPRNVIAAGPPGTIARSPRTAIAPSGATARGTPATSQHRSSDRRPWAGHHAGRAVTRAGIRLDALPARRLCQPCIGAASSPPRPPAGLPRRRELAPLLRTLPPGRTPLEIAQSWSNRMPLESGMAIAGWLVAHGILVEQHGQSGAQS